MQEAGDGGLKLRGMHDVAAPLREYLRCMAVWMWGVVCMDASDAIWDTRLVLWEYDAELGG